MCVSVCVFFLSQVIGLGKSGRSAVKLALARGASVVAIDQNENLGFLEVLLLLLCISLIASSDVIY